MFLLFTSLLMQYKKLYPPEIYVGGIIFFIFFFLLQQKILFKSRTFFHCERIDLNLLDFYCVSHTDETVQKLKNSSFALWSPFVVIVRCFTIIFFSYDFQWILKAWCDADKKKMRKRLPFISIFYSVCSLFIPFRPFCNFNNAIYTGFVL